LTLARSVEASPAPIPAEERLAQTQEGQAQLKQMHQALFTAGQAILKKQLEDIVGRKIYEMVSDLEPLSGKNTIAIRHGEAICSSPRLLRTASIRRFRSSIACRNLIFAPVIDAKWCWPAAWSFLHIRKT
jgi:hypothetical protein